MHEQGLKMKKKILFITSDYYPYEGANSNIISRLLYDGGLISNCYDIHILTCSFERESVEKANNVTIHRALLDKPLRKKTLLKSLLCKPIKTLKQLSNIVLAKVGLAKTPIMDIDKKKSYCRYLRHHIDLEEYDLFIPLVADYCTVECVVELFKTLHNANRPSLILYQLDPFSENRVLLKHYEQKYLMEKERNYYKIADRIITTPIIAREQKLWLDSELYHKVVPLEFPLVSINHRVGRKVDMKGRINCVYSGLIYEGIRSPNYSISMFNRFSDLGITLHLVGVYRQQLSIQTCGNILCYGKVDREQARLYVENADFLVLIGNSITNQVPSKLFDYISEGKPIINICKNRNCPTLPYLAKYPLSITLFEETELMDEQAELLLKFIQENIGKTVDPNVIETNYEMLTPQYCCSVLKRIIDK